MNEFIEIIFFLPERKLFEPVNLADSLKKALPELGDAMVLPVKVDESENQENHPVVLFNQEESFQMIVSFYTLSFILNKKDEAKKFDIIKRLLKVTKKHDLNFGRLGYMNSFFVNKINAKALKEDIFKSEELLNAKDFQLAWYKSININKEDINYWIRLNSNTEVSSDLYVTHDFNTRVDKVHNIDYTFTKDFITSVDKII